jgi:hypothetical protein
MLRVGSWLAFFAACTSSPGGTIDGPTATPDGALGDGGTAYTCSETIDAYCAGPATCMRMWKDVPTCGRPLSGTGTCGPYMVYVAGGVDTSMTSYYDAEGKLVAAVDSGIGHVGCAAGPSTFVAPACGTLTPLPACPDAGP